MQTRWKCTREFDKEDQEITAEKLAQNQLRHALRPAGPPPLPTTRGSRRFLSEPPALLHVLPCSRAGASDNNHPAGRGRRRLVSHGNRRQAGVEDGWCRRRESSSRRGKGGEPGSGGVPGSPSGGQRRRSRRTEGSIVGSGQLQLYCRVARE